MSPPNPRPAVPLPPPHLIQGLDQGSDLLLALVVDHAPADLEGVRRRPEPRPFPTLGAPPSPSISPPSPSPYLLLVLNPPALHPGSPGHRLPEVGGLGGGRGRVRSPVTVFTPLPCRPPHLAHLGLEVGVKVTQPFRSMANTQPLAPSWGIDRELRPGGLGRISRSPGSSPHPAFHAAGGCHLPAPARGPTCHAAPSLPVKPSPAGWCPHTAALTHTGQLCGT